MNYFSSISSGVFGISSVEPSISANRGLVVTAVKNEQTILWI
jgi:hypothetical protein